MKAKITFLLLVFSFFFANAQVRFEDHTVIDNSLQLAPQSIFSADFDGDGDKDILSSSLFANRLVWIENFDGVGGDYRLHTISTVIQYPWGVYAADLDGDGDMDAVAAASGNGTIIWYENTDGRGTFVLKQAMYAYQANLVMAADMDNDNDLDLVWSSKSDGAVQWLVNSNGLGNFNSSWTIDTNIARVLSIYPADMDGDGDKDVVAAYSLDGTSEAVRWYKNNGSGNGIWPKTEITSISVNYVNSVYAGDMDGDGDMDVTVAGNNKISWYKNNGSGTFGPQQILTDAASNATVVRLADIDGDADLDVVFGSNDDRKLSSFKNLDGLGSFGSETLITNHLGIGEISFSDMDADGDLDFVAITTGLKLFKNTDGAGTFTSSVITKSIDGGRGVVAADIDGDGDKDIIGASYWDDKIAWYENLDGQGNFYNTQKIISQTVDGATSVCAADINGDGFIDILATSYLSENVVWFKNTDGLGTFAAPLVIGSGVFNSLNVFAVDIDNDGDLDVIGSGRGKISLYKNLDRQGTFSSPQIIDAQGNSNTYDIDFGDLDGDGDLDIVAAYSYGTFYYRNLNGQGTFGAPQTIQSLTSYSVKMADFDNDGDKDIVYTGKNINTSEPPFLRWVKNNGNATFGTTQTISTLIANPKSIIVADFDADGDIDIVSADAGNGGVIALYDNTDGLGAFTNTQQIISRSLNSPYSLFVADIDGNNKMDIVSTSEYDDKVVWHENLGIPTTNSITGIVRFDLLGDGCTETDALVSGTLVVATDTSGTNATFSQENGQFQIYTTEGGTVTTQVNSQLPTYYSANPASYQSNFAGLGNNDTVNFCIAPITNINDLSVSFYALGNAPRPGFMTGYRIVYKNRGTTQLSGSVSFVYDNSKLNFLNASTAIASQNGNTLTFDFTGLNPLETKSIDVRFSVYTAPTTNIGDVLTTTASINPVADDYIAGDNVFTYRQAVVGSWDPNDVRCLEGDRVLIQDADKYLHYLIRFQNTGTADAINVRVDNVLDDKLDWTTMQLESLSHPGRVAIHNGREVSFIFNNINLPDSTSDEPNSHGFIAYKIKPKNVVVGDILNATASIYFDFNPAVVTNTAATQFVETLGVSDFEVDKVSVYPNPTNGMLNITSDRSIKTIELYNQLGQLMLSAKDVSAIDVSSLGKGIYMMTMKDVSGATFTKRIIKK